MSTIFKFVITSFLFAISASANPQKWRENPRLLNMAPPKFSCTPTGTIETITENRFEYLPDGTGNFPAVKLTLDDGFVPFGPEGSRGERAQARIFKTGATGVGLIVTFPDSDSSLHLLIGPLPQFKLKFFESKTVSPLRAYELAKPS